MKGEQQKIFERWERRRTKCFNFISVIQLVIEKSYIFEKISFSIIHSLYFIVVYAMYQITLLDTLYKNKIILWYK